MATTINLFDNGSTLTIQIKGKNTKMANFIASFATECYEDGEDLILFFNEKDKEKFSLAISVNVIKKPIKVEGLISVPYEEPEKPSIPQARPPKKKSVNFIDEMNQKIFFGSI